MKKSILITTLAAFGLMGAVQMSGNKQISAAMTSNTIPKTTATVDYVKGYGIALTKNGKRSKIIKTGTRWTTKKKVYANGQTYYDLGGGQLANIKYMTITNENSGQTYKGTFHLAYSSAVFRTAGGKYAGRSLKANTNWQATKQRIIDGKAYVNIGGSNWVKKANGYLKSDKGRGNKTFYASAKVGTEVKLNADQTLKTVKPSKNNHYVPNSATIKKLVTGMITANIQPNKYGMSVLPASAKQGKLVMTLADGTELLRTERYATAHGYYSSDKEVAASLYKQLIAAGMAQDFTWPTRYYKISATSSGKMTGLTGSIKAKATFDTYSIAE
jgi:hypothetical protein